MVKAIYDLAFLKYPYPTSVYEAKDVCQDHTKFPLPAAVSPTSMNKECGVISMLCYC